jgi:hypothetical protein
MERLRRGERIEHYETVRMRKDGSQSGSKPIFCHPSLSRSSSPTAVWIGARAAWGWGLLYLKA